MSRIDEKRAALIPLMRERFKINGPRVDLCCQHPSMLAAREVAARYGWVNFGVTAMRGAK
jgi:hypothetical protein